MKTPKEYILVINSGSATLKFKIYHRLTFSVVLEGIVERIGLPGSFINLSEMPSRRMIMKNFPEGLPDHAAALKTTFSHLKHWQPKIHAFGHRMVHGGTEFSQSIVINRRNLTLLRAHDNLAPLHNPINVACLDYCLSYFPTIKQVAVFDTALYRHLPPAAYMYALPFELYEKYGIRRYGFHGISHQYVAEQAALKRKVALKKIKMITCHLGSGCSITALKNGSAVENSMGFTPLAGLMMATRSGDIDPGILFYLQKQLGLTVGQIEDMLQHDSGLKGIFGVSGDMRDVLLAAGYRLQNYKASKRFNKKEKYRAKLALEMFIYNVVRYIGSYATGMGGVDVIVFTGGIGERSPLIRRLVSKRISKAFPRVKSLVIPTNEELMIARQTSKLAA